MGGNMYLNKSDKKRRFSVYVYSDTEHYVRVNHFYETYIDAQKTVQELKTRVHGYITSTTSTLIT